MEPPEGFVKGLAESFKARNWPDLPQPLDGDSASVLPISLGGTLPEASVKKLRDGMRAKVHAASRWLAELATVASASEAAQTAETSDHLASQLSLRYLSTVCSLIVTVCQLPPRPQNLPLMNALMTFLTDSTGGSALVSTKEDAFVQPSLQAASTSLAITGRTALLQELNELCGLLRPHAAGEGELHQAMRRAIGAMRQELMPLLQHAFAWELHEHQGAGHAPPHSGIPPQNKTAHPAMTMMPRGDPRAGLLTPDLRMRGLRGGGGGSNLGKSGKEFPDKLYKVRHELPTPGPTFPGHSPEWLARSQSLPKLSPLERKSARGGTRSDLFRHEK